MSNYQKQRNKFCQENPLVFYAVNKTYFMLNIDTVRCLCIDFKQTETNIVTGWCNKSEMIFYKVF